MHEDVSKAVLKAQAPAHDARGQALGPVCSGGERGQKLGARQAVGTTPSLTLEQREVVGHGNSGGRALSGGGLSGGGGRRGLFVTHLLLLLLLLLP